MKLLSCLLLGLISSIAFAANPQVEIKTNQGPIVLELYPDKAPKTVENFLQYVKEDHYRQTIFHRVIDGFMIQGGGFDKFLSEKPTRKSIQNEANNGLKNEAGTIAMARTMDPHSASAQFFINLNNNDFLNYTQPTMRGWGYAVFGKVVQGMDVVQKIGKVRTYTYKFYENVPGEPVIIESVKVISH